MGKVTKKKLKRYGWVIHTTYHSQYVRHPNFAENKLSYCTESNRITSLYKLFTPCRTMKELKAYVLKHTGEKMQKVKQSKEVTNVASNIASVSVESLKHIELPKRWEDIDVSKNIYVDWIKDNSEIGTALISSLAHVSDKNILPKGLGSPMLATCQLLLLRDVYRQGWAPDWRSENGSTEKFAIAFSDNKVHFRKYFGDYASQWSFQSEEIAKLFLDNFKPLLQEHYKLYN